MILIADAGNSKTDWVLISGQRVVSTIKLAGLSPYFDTKEAILHKVEEAANRLGNPQPEEIRFFGTGCLHDSMRNKVVGAIQKYFPKSIIHVSDDLTAAGIALFGDDEGVVAITGTGSNAGIIQGTEIAKRTHSLGYLLGDEGSGSDLGFRFLKLLLSENLPGDLSNHIYKTSQHTAEGLLAKLYAAPKPQTFAASFIPFVQSHRQQPAIQAMIQASFKSMLTTMILPLTQESLNLPIGFCGSIASIFEEELREVFNAQNIHIKSILPEPVSKLAAYYQTRESVK